jgi:uncharacterized protein YndB with AHSA1/START domain
MTDPTLATVLEADGQVALRYVRHLDHPPEKVWRAITESEHLRHWLPTDIVGERREGAAIQLPFWPEHVERFDMPTAVLDGEILVWDPPKVFEWMWSTDRLRFELAPEGDGTTLTFTTWLSGAGASDTKQASGYHLCLDQLAELLDTGTTERQLVDLDQEPLDQRYEELLSRG